MQHWCSATSLRHADERNSQQEVRHVLRLLQTAAVEIVPVCAEKLDSNILVMQPTDHGMRHDTADLLDWARNGRIHVQ